MQTSLKPKVKQGIRQHYLLIGGFFFMILVAALTFLFTADPSKKAVASYANENFASGSYIINMGITPQTTANGLKPYGLIFDLMKNHQIPVKWVINPSKSKDGTDFSYNSVNYNGGPFVIPAEFITPAVANTIANWNAQGVSGVYTTSSLSLPVYTTLTTFPLVMIDSLASLHGIIENYYANAGISPATYTIGSPAGLTQCYDIWTNPHGDPTWTTHSYLYDFVTVQKSWIWAECHSVSMMEYCKSSGTPVKQLNFLSTTGLKCWGSNKCETNPETHAKSPSSPFTYYYHNDPVMQFMGNMHGACMAGSEQWYQPISSGQWNSTTRRGVTTGSGTSPKEGSLLTYGPAYGDASNGWVMYIGGHDLTSVGTTPEQVAAQRAYFNFILLAGTYKKLNVTASIPSSVNTGGTYPVSSIVTSGTPGYTYQWTSHMGGGFDNANSASTNYTAPYVTKDTTDLVRISVTDQCGRVNFYYQWINISPSPLPVSLVSFSGTNTASGIQLKWVTASEINNDYFTLEKSMDGRNYGFLAKIPGAGNSNNKLYYQWIDRENNSSPVYYRLSQTDYDGKMEYFRPLVIRVKRSDQPASRNLTLSPNPFNTTFSMEIISNEEQSAELQLYGLDGKLISNKVYALQQGNNTLFYTDNGQLPDGIYIAVVKTSGQEIKSGKIVKR